MAELFGVEIPTINYHLKEIFKTNELDEKATIRNFLIVQKEGTRQVSREIDFYNLDAIIAVGYRVNSIEATRFRIWSTKTLREFIIKGSLIPILNHHILPLPIRYRLKKKCPPSGVVALRKRDPLRIKLLEHPTQ
jgi:Virulence protein RhuM family